MIEKKIVEFRLYIILFFFLYIIDLRQVFLFRFSKFFLFYFFLHFTFRKILIDESIVKIFEKNNKCFFIFQRKIYVQFCLPITLYQSKTICLLF